MVSEYMSCYPDYVKAPLIFYKDNASRIQRQVYLTYVKA